MLEIRDLRARVDGKQILKGLNLVLGPGQLHAIMGPNGSGKSTLANVLAGREGYEIEGEVLFNGRDLLAMKPEERAREGVFLAFQYPVEIPGITNAWFLRTAVNAVRQHRGLDPYDAIDFVDLLREKVASVGFGDDMMARNVNEGFSGGEKKRNEMLQMALLEPSLAILDETDSGLDIDALRIVAEGIKAARTPERSFLVITHYPRLLDYLEPEVVHVLADGRLVRSGGPELARELEQRGYQWLAAE